MSIPRIFFSIISITFEFIFKKIDLEVYAPVLLFMPVYVYYSFSRLLFQLFQYINSSRFRESVI